jgi:cytochrome P450
MTAEDIPLHQIDVSNPALYANDSIHALFARLRREAPIHFCAESDYGPYWSMTRYDDILKVDGDPNTFSSDGQAGGHMLNYDKLFPAEDEFQLPMFIAMDEPSHGVQRSTVTPIVAPRNLSTMKEDIRNIAIEILDSLPEGETFDWVEHVSIELTTRVLAKILDFPFADRHLLTHWSDITMVESDDPDEQAQRRDELSKCAEYFTHLWSERKSREPGNDLISMLAHGPATQNMSAAEYLGNTLLLIVGGNDTTRNTLSASALAMNLFPGEFTKLQRNPALVSSMVPEIIRWQTPLAHMARTATKDVTFQGQHIRAGQRVAMWYISGNRDESAIDTPDQVIVDRESPRRHLSFGFGIHRCMGNRLAELQLTLVWEEILKRFEQITLEGEPQRTCSNIIHGYTAMPVRVIRSNR